MASIESMGSFDLTAVQTEAKHVADALSDLHDSFRSSLGDVFGSVEEATSTFDIGTKSDSNLINRPWITSNVSEFDASGVSGIPSWVPERIRERAVSDGVLSHGSLAIPYEARFMGDSMAYPSTMDLAKRMLDGIDLPDGTHSVGLEEISQFKINPDFRTQNINQQSGYAAEVLSTAIENLLAEPGKDHLTTYRTDDCPDLYRKNDQFVDKIRVNDAGEVVERVQTKFVGKDGADWVSKMMQKKFDKYFEGDHVDKIECPKDFYNDAKADIARRLEKVQKQLDSVTEQGKVDVVAKKQATIDRLSKFDDMIEQSVITKQEAIDARLKPRRTTTKMVLDDVMPTSINEGIHSAAITAGLTLVSSAVIHGREFFDGEISARELAKEVAIETGAAGAIDGVSDFVSTAVATAMRGSSHELIQSVGGSVLPAVAISFAVESYDSISDYAQGIIDGGQLAYELGENAASIGGGAWAGMQVGAMAGTVAGPVGTVAGGLVGGLVGSVVASEVYVTAVDCAPEICQGIAGQIEGFTSMALDAMAKEVPDKVEDARASFNEYFESNNIPVRA